MMIGDKMFTYNKGLNAGLKVDFLYFYLVALLVNDDKFYTLFRINIYEVSA